MRRIVIAGAVALVACGGEEQVVEAGGCSLPDCGAVAELGPMGWPLEATGSSGFLAFEPEVEGRGALWHHDLHGGRRPVAPDVPASSVVVDPAGSAVLYLVATGRSPAVSGEWTGELHRWEIRTGSDAQLLPDARGDQFGACGDWVWSWHGAGDYVNCGWMSALQLSTGRWFDLGDSCDFGAVDRLAAFSADCRLLATGTGYESQGVGVHHLGGESRLVPAGTGRFVVPPQLDRVAAASKSFGGVLLADLATGEERMLADAGYVHAFSPSGRALLFQRGEQLIHLLGDRETVLAEEYVRVEALGFSPDERRIAWADAGYDRVPRLRLFDLATGSVEVIAEDVSSGNEALVPEVELRPLHFDASGSRLLYARHGQGGRELVLHDVAAGESLLLGSLDGAPEVAPGRFAAWRNLAGALLLADLRSGTTWQVSARVDGLRFVGETLVWNEGGKGFRAPLPTGENVRAR